MRNEILGKVFNKNILDSGRLEAYFTNKQTHYRKCEKTKVILSHQTQNDVKVSLLSECVRNSRYIEVTPMLGTAYMVLISAENQNNSYVIDKIENTESDSLFDITKEEAENFVREFLGGL